MDEPVLKHDLEEALILLVIFKILGRLHEANPLLVRDCQEECWLSLKEKNNRAPTDRRFTQIAVDDLVRFVTGATEVDKGLAQQCAAAALLPSRLKNVLDVCRKHWSSWQRMKPKAK